VLFTAVYQRETLACLMVSYLGYDEFELNLFIDNDLSDQERNETVAIVNKARDRVVSIYEDMASTPIIIVSSSGEKLAKFGVKLPVPGAVHALPWGQYVVINDVGNNIDVLAPEFTHAETAHSVGYIKWQLSLPIWFKEGVTMQVDHRERYRYKGNSLPEMFELDSLQKFNSANITNNYIAAKVEA
jgi:hypothetical protein